MIFQYSEHFPEDREKKWTRSVSYRVSKLIPAPGYMAVLRAEYDGAAWFHEVPVVAWAEATRREVVKAVKGESWTIVETEESDAALVALVCDPMHDGDSMRLVDENWNGYQTDVWAFRWVGCALEAFVRERLGVLFGDGYKVTMEDGMVRATRETPDAPGLPMKRCACGCPLEPDGRTCRGCDTAAELNGRPSA